MEALWRSFFLNPAEWWDNRLIKTDSRVPDFRHKVSKEGLWVEQDGTPSWVVPELGFMEGASTQETRSPLEWQGCVTESCEWGGLRRHARSSAGGDKLDVRVASLESRRQANLLNKFKDRTSQHGAEADVRITHGRNQELKKLCEEGRIEEALEVLKQRSQHSGMVLNETYGHLFEACSKIRSLDMARRAYALVTVKGGEVTEAYLCSAVIKMFVKCGSLPDALLVFNRSTKPNVSACKTVILGLAVSGQGREALRVYHRMIAQRLKPDKHTFLCVLKVCSKLADLQEGKRIHADVARVGLESDLFIGTTLVNMYVKCGSMVDAQGAFDRVVPRNVLSWNVLIAGYAQQDENEIVLRLYNEMRDQGVNPHDRIFVSVVKGYGSMATLETETMVDGQPIKLQALEKGKRMHCEVLEWGYESDAFVATALIDMYAKCGSITDAQYAFNLLSQRNIASWNALLSGYSYHGHAETVLQLYSHMQKQGVEPSVRTFVTVLKACGSVAALEDEQIVYGELAKPASLQRGKAIHAEVYKMGFETNVFVSNTLVHMYANCGSFSDALMLFDRLGTPDVIAWNAIVSGYVRQKQSGRALELYTQMQKAGVEPDKWTFVSVLQACGSVAALEEVPQTGGHPVKQDSLQKGRVIHAQIRRYGCESDPYVSSALIDMYGKSGSMTDAEHVFESLARRDVVSWNALISGYAQQEQGMRAIQLYSRMQEEGAIPDEATYLSMLKVCGGIGALSMCTQIHVDMVKSGLGSSLSMGNTLILAYAKCGSSADSKLVFDSLPKRSQISWNAMIAAYTLQGDYDKSMECFQEMQEAGVKPDGYTLSSLLVSCSRAGMLYKGLHYFQYLVRDCGISATDRHYASLIDLVGRAGLLHKAEDLMLHMPDRPGFTTWMSLLSACRIHHNVELGRRAFEQALRLEPKHSAPYMVMENIYAQAEMWDCADKVLELRAQSLPWKRRGQSWIECDKNVHVFAAGDKSHIQTDRIHAQLSRLASKIG